MDIVDQVLSIPKNIDFYIYAPGSGGEFFTSLIALSHKKTREILKLKYFDGLKNDEGLMRYNRPQYFTYDENFKFLNLNINNEFYNEVDLLTMLGHLMSPLDRINYCKMLLFQGIFQSMLPNRNKDEFKENINMFKGVNIILSTHWIELPLLIKTKNFESRNFGLKLFEKEKYWNVINLDPQTEKGRNLVLNFCKKYKLITNVKKVEMQFNHSAFSNIKLKFPFMDYMATGDFNSIKNYITNRYGPDLDYEFIDKALIDYKKLRIEPYL